MFFLTFVADLITTGLKTWNETLGSLNPLSEPSLPSLTTEEARTIESMDILGSNNFFEFLLRVTCERTRTSEDGKNVWSSDVVERKELHETALRSPQLVSVIDFVHSNCHSG